MERVPVEGGARVRESWEEPRAVRYTSDYLKRLLIERHHIRAALENPGGSVILTGSAADVESITDYSSVIGNDYHLDLLEAEELLVETLPAQEVLAILLWADGFTQRQAADFAHLKRGAIRMRVSRAFDALETKANEGEDARRDG